MYLNRNNIKERIKGTFMDVLGVKFIETDDPDTLEATMEVKEIFSQTMGILHGGAIMSLADSVAGIGSNVLCGDDEKCLGMQVSTSFIASARIGDTIHGKGRILHKGKSTHVWNVSITSVATGKLVSEVTVTNAVLKKKK